MMEAPINAEPDIHRTILTAVASRVGHSVVAELQPIIDAIVASLREGRRIESRSVSVSLPVIEGQTLVVSVHAGIADREPRSQAAGPQLDARQLELIDGAIDERIGEVTRLRCRRRWLA